MIKRPFSVAVLALFASATCVAQSRGSGAPPASLPGIQGSTIARGAAPSLLTRMDVWSVVRDNKNSPVQVPAGSVSALDLKAPAKARNEYDRGYTSLMRKNFSDAVAHLTAAISIYPKFVAAHNALGSAYLELGESRLARDEFAEAVSLDDHLPGSHLNLGCADLALEDYSSAVEAIQKASSLAPLDNQIMTTLSYAEFMNQDYAAVTTIARNVHSRKHDGAAMVHYYAAAAWQRQSNWLETTNELQNFLREDPKSARAEQAQKALDAIQVRESQLRRSAEPSSVKNSQPSDNSAEGNGGDAITLALARQESQQQRQITEAEAAVRARVLTGLDSASDESSTVIASRTSLEPAHASSPKGITAGAFLLRSVVDEVAVMFTANDHGKPVTNLTREDVAVLDARKPPAAITGFRTQADLPLRLGVIIDTSDSVSSEFSFEQRSAIHFLEHVVTGGNDLAFLVGVSNSVLVVQDYTNDQQQLAHAVSQLAPGGGTALWDAVSYAAQKLASREETEPVAKLLVVISDGKDNSSRASLKEAIESAELGDVFVYTLCTAGVGEQRDPLVEAHPNLLGPRAMKLLAQATGGASLAPRSFRGLDSTLGSIQELIRSRYLISYKPADFTPDGTYRGIEISANKSGHKVRVYARRGYYARKRLTAENTY